MLKWFGRGVAALMVAALLLTAACTYRQSVNGVNTSHNVNSTDAGLLGNLKQDAANGNKLAVKGDKLALKESGNVQTAAGLRWLLLAGVVILAVGGAATFEFGSALGGGIVALGAGLVVASILTTALLPYQTWIAGTLIAAGLVYLLIRYRAKLKRSLNDGK